MVILFQYKSYDQQSSDRMDMQMFSQPMSSLQQNNFV